MTKRSIAFYAEKAVALRSQGYSWPVIWQKLEIPDLSSTHQKTHYL